MIASAKLATTSTFSLLSNLKIQPIDFVICSKLLTSSGSTIARRAIGGKYRCGLPVRSLRKQFPPLRISEGRKRLFVCASAAGSQPSVQGSETACPCHRGRDANGTAFLRCNPDGRNIEIDMEMDHCEFRTSWSCRLRDFQLACCVKPAEC